jgi:hypothetical protein
VKNKTDSKVDKMADDLVTVILKTQHIHAGKTYPAGETLTVNQAMKKWLIEMGVVDPDPELI